MIALFKLQIKKSIQSTIISIRYLDSIFLKKKKDDFQCYQKKIFILIIIQKYFLNN